MYKNLPLFALLACACAQSGDLESIIHQIFDVPSTSTTTHAPVVNRAPSTVVPSVTQANATDLSCTMDDGQVGECVTYYLCNTSNNTIITDGTGVIDIRFRDGPCQSYIDTCCLVPEKRPVTDPIIPKPDPAKPE